MSCSAVIVAELVSRIDLLDAACVDENTAAGDDGLDDFGGDDGCGVGHLNLQNRHELSPRKYFHPDQLYCLLWHPLTVHSYSMDRRLNLMSYHV